MDHHQLHHHQYNAGPVSIDTGSSGDRFPQWSIQETRDFLAIRAELDPTFMETKRNKLLWEVISTRMKEKGYSRSAEQCKCKWKNLVTRYKGCETMEAAEGMRQQQFPFYNEIQTILAARMQRMIWLEAEGGATTSKKKSVAAGGQFSSDEEDELNELETSEGEKNSKKKRKLKGAAQQNTNVVTSSTSSSVVSIISGLKDMMEDFMKQQMQMEIQWLRSYEAREEDRKVKEMEWRQTMEALENERIMMDRRWREREEQRKIREEARAEKRDALITALLNKLRRSDNQDNM